MIRQIIVLGLIALVLPQFAHAQKIEPAPRVVTSDHLARYWVMMNASVVADVSVGAKNIDLPGCAAVSFVVEKNGRTSQVKVQKVEPEGDLARVAMSVASNLEFEPTITNAGRDRVFSWLIFPFNLPPDPAAKQAIMERCVIAPLKWSDR